MSASAVSTSVAREPDPAPVEQSSRLASVDCLRGLAALAVVIAHSSDFASASATGGSAWFRNINEVLHYGGRGVPLFFVISGFCIHLQWARNNVQTGQGAPDFVRFWKRRLFRLYPPYVVALCVSMALVLATSVLGIRNLFLATYSEPRTHWIAADILAHLLMLHGLHPVLDKAGGNSAFWTLAREEYFYLMYFGLIAVRRGFGPLRTLGSVFLSGLAFWVLMHLALPRDSMWWQIVRNSAPVLWVQWCLGMVAVEAFFGLVRLPSWCYWGWSVPLWTVAAIWCHRHCYALSPLLWGLTFFVLINWCVQREKHGNWPQHRLTSWLTRVGVFSYSLYLIHFPVMRLLDRLTNLPVLNNDTWFYLVKTLIFIVTAYLAGKAFFAVVERHFLPGRRATFDRSAHRAASPPAAIRARARVER
jgi:peptidoglycan/LPS O-acetylase OafA/YrhL